MSIRWLARGSAQTALLLSVFVIGCGFAGSGPDTPDDTIDSHELGLTIANGALTMKVGEAVRLDAIPVDSAGTPFRGLFTLAWSSSNAAVAAVTGDGTLTAKAEGTARLTATATRLDTGATATAFVDVTVGAAAGSGSGGTPSPGGGGPTVPSAPAESGTSGGPVTASFSASNAELPNPERGLYGWSGNDFVNGFDSASVAATYTAGQRLVMAKVQLNAYRTSDIPASFLTTLEQRFASVRAAGLKTTLLFNYDFSASGQDASATQIKRHLEQLKPVLDANADVIPFMRAGFIGAWGEWHSSKSGNACNGTSYGVTSCATADANRLIVRDALLANVPSSTQVGFRYPADLLKWYPSPTQQTRAGVHNDCFLAGPSDSGTYTSSTQRPYVKALSAETAFGGENCNNAESPVRNTCNDILTEGAAYHLAWLNASDWSGFMTAWKNGGCYAQVTRSIGYRVQLDRVTHAARVTRGGAINVDVDLRNVGWARLFGGRKLVVTLKHKATGAKLSASGAALQTLPSQATASSRLSVVVPIPSGAATGDYDVYVSAPDVFPRTATDGRFAVRFANTDNAPLKQAWSAADAAFGVGTTIGVM